MRILHYGDSPTAGDLITSDARAIFQKQFGDGGAGSAHRQTVGLVLSSGRGYGVLEVDHRRGRRYEIKDGMHGLGGASFQGSTGARRRFHRGRGTLGGSRFLCSSPKAGHFLSKPTGTQIWKVETAARQSEEKPHPAWKSFALPEGSRKFSLRVESGRVRLYGVEFSKGQARGPVQQFGCQRREHHAAQPGLQRCGLDSSVASLPA